MIPLQHLDLITAFPNKTTDLLINHSIFDLFDYYMIPINKLAYMMDIPSFFTKRKTGIQS